MSRGVLVEALDVLIAEMPRAVEMATQGERAAVVAWLREWASVGRIATGYDYANEIERGEHRREEE